MELFWQILKENAPSLEAFTTVILAGLTLLALKESQANRKDSALPFLIAEGFTFKVPKGEAACCVKTDIQNIGKGIALNVMISFYDAETRREVMSSEHYLPYIYPDKTGDTRVHIAQGELENLRFDTEGSALLKGVIEFEDTFGRQFSFERLFVYEKKDSSIKPVASEVHFKQKRKFLS